MSLKVIWTSRFKKDYKTALKRGLNIDLLDNVIRILAKGDKLPEQYNDHSLQGDLKGFREC
ncbi:MAG: type II toxin-antitoxin system YafQ family toxin, partial [Firmicutes bacterium]|nr:type II toxin-antitoxin system YafQ family toxin [Bacillota bacterium]